MSLYISSNQHILHFKTAGFKIYKLKFKLYFHVSIIIKYIIMFPIDNQVIKTEEVVRLRIKKKGKVFF